ncbi:hypothetical protein [Pigmentiphaga kullae]|uniref:Uncharacterized protein n=1 Tax=Pigmentiphaga kullae TaxID=151784 RepID=A0A4Q7NIB8_9BURK|nr:hypothetical protein [Pigmentiphaga kullae]RZS84220.1 hypothetical protein EV675_0228 [Pigmentiphaga kullae]
MEPVLSLENALGRTYRAVLCTVPGSNIAVYRLDDGVIVYKQGDGSFKDRKGVTYRKSDLREDGAGDAGAEI